MLCYSAGEISFIDISKDWRVELEGKSLKSDLPYYKTGYTGKMILRKKITLNEKASIYLYLSKIDDEDIVYFNGKEVGKTPVEWYGKYNYKSYYFIDRIYVVPTNYIVRGENEIKIEIKNT